MSAQKIKHLFSLSAQRLALLDWLQQRAHFEKASDIAALFSQLHELERIQVFGHLDFLLSDLPLLDTPAQDPHTNIDSFSAHLEKTTRADLKQARESLKNNEQHDAADWVNSVIRQQEEMLRILHEFQTPKHHSQLRERPPRQEDVIAHFSERASRYDRSSHWCTDTELRNRVLSILSPKEDARVLDVACGTGLVSQWFHKKVAHVLGVDITPAMAEQAQNRLDEFRTGYGESLPVDSNQFDIVICRQGTQFMQDDAAIAEMVRAAKPGGVVCVINLCAYGQEDKEEYFEILRLRNPVRRNFYLIEDLQKLFVQAGLTEVAVHRHISIEDVDVWSNNGAISEARREAIRAIYRSASDIFAKHHHVTHDQGTIIDNMLFGIAVGIKPF